MLPTVVMNFKGFLRTPEPSEIISGGYIGVERPEVAFWTKPSSSSADALNQTIFFQ